MLLATVGVMIDGVEVIDRGLDGAQAGQAPSRRGWLSFTRTSSALPVAAVAAKVFLTV